MSRRNKTWLSFPRAIAVVSVLCTFVILNFQTPANRKYVHKKAAKRFIRKAEAPLSVEAAKTDQPKSDSNSQESLASAAPDISKADISVQAKQECATVFSVLGRAPEKIGSHQLVKPIKVAKKQNSKPQKRKLSLLTKRTRRVPRLTKTIPLWINDEFENPALNSQDAFDNPSPLDELALTSFMEQSQSPVFDGNQLLALVHWDIASESDFPFVMERPLLVKESFFKKVEFTDLRETLNSFRDEDTVALVDLELPQQKLAWNKLLEIPSAPKLDDLRSGTSGLVKNESVEKQVVDSQVAQVDPLSEPGVIETKNEPTLQVASRTPSLEQPRSKKEFNRFLSPNLASAGSALQSALENSLVSEKPKSEMTSQVSKVVGTSSTNIVNSQKQRSNEDVEDQSELGVLYGELVVDNQMVSWLETNKGYIGLYLTKEGSRDPQDTIFLMDYQFPASGNTFELERTGLKGKYRLIAGVYIPTSTVPVAEIPYSKSISSENFKEKIRLAVSKAALDLTPSRIEANRSQVFVPLTVTLFDGAPSNYRSPKTIKSGEVSVVGIPELGKYSVDQDGNVRIPRVPVASEIVLEVSSPGYMPTRQVVPVFDSAAYSPIYLVQKDKVDVLTRYFTKRPQQLEKSVLMGRAYDVESRSPLAGEKISLSYRKGPTVYFGALPDLNHDSTLETGLFGFFNIESSIRSIGRGESKHSLLVDFQPGYGYFIEFGRGGSRDLLGSLIDPFNQQKVQGSIQLVGDLGEPLVTELDGKFKVENIDLPPGVITIEAQAEGYPITWFTVPWSVRESVRARSYYMMERELLKESASRIARVRHEKNTGVIVGGANTSLFNQNRQSFRVELLDKSGKVVPQEHGPYSLSQVPKGKNPYALTVKDPGFAFFNMSPGEYILKMSDDQGNIFRTHVVRVGVERVSVVVN